MSFFHAFFLNICSQNTVINRGQQILGLLSVKPQSHRGPGDDQLWWITKSGPLLTSMFHKTLASKKQNKHGLVAGDKVTDQLLHHTNRISRATISPENFKDHTRTRLSQLWTSVRRFSVRRLLHAPTELQRWVTEALVGKTIDCVFVHLLIYK